MKPSLLSRYVLKAWLGYLLGSLLLFGGLLLIHETVNLTKGLLAERASFKWLPIFLGLAIPEVLALVLPMASLFAGLMGTQQLAQGSELVAAQGLGTGSRVLVRPWVLLSGLLIGLAGLNAHWVIPEAHRMQTRLRTQLAEEAKQRFLRPGAPPLPMAGDPPQALWTSPGGQVHILEVNPKGVQHLISDRVSWRWDPAGDRSSTLSLRLDEVSGSYLPRDGGGAAQLRQTVQTISFPIKLSTGDKLLTSFRDASTPDLLSRRDPDAQAELARRLTLPLLSSALLLVGIGLGFGHPRFQRGSGVLGGLGVMVVYYVAYRTLEGRLDPANLSRLYILIFLPLVLGAFATLLLSRRIRPHRSLDVPGWGWVRKGFSRLGGLRTSGASPHRDVTPSRSRDVLGAWSRTLWLKAWGGVLVTLLFLHLLIEFSSRAGAFSATPTPALAFFEYWIWRVPTFLITALPVSFMLGTVLALSTATLSNEWVALRTGGVSLWQWVWRARGAWLAVLAGTLLLNNVAAPAGEVRVRRIEEGLSRRSVDPGGQSRWQYLGATGVLWYIEPDVRWGFPLKPPGEAPALLVWRPGQVHSQGLPWGGFALQQGPASERLFPDASLLGTPIPEENSTLALLRWQRWAYEPGRAAHLWARLLGWLAGPCLVFAVLARAFPNPRAGRGGALAGALVAGLLFLGLQLLFNGAAQAGEIPAAWGVLGPLLLAVGTGAMQLRNLRT